LPPKLQESLQAVLDHAERIRVILRRLQSVEDRLTPYVKDIQMIDLKGIEVESPEGGDKK